MKATLSVFVLLLTAAFAQAQTVVLFSTPGQGAWTIPAGTTQLTIECVGGGGSGGAGNGGAFTSGSGGGGGAYARTNYTVAAGHFKPGQVITYWVGAGGQFIQPGWPSGASLTGGSVYNVLQGVVADGGTNGDKEFIGIGGRTAVSIGTTVVPGASGGIAAKGMQPNPLSGGGGGGGVDPTAPTPPAAGQPGSINGAGGIGGTFGGAGSSFTAMAPAGNGTNGGGGGGAAAQMQFPSQNSGGPGGNGWVKITYR